jgi:hypothetical protein
MNAKQLLIASTISASLMAAAGTALAGETAAAGTTRDAVKASVLQARAAGTLQPAGEAFHAYVYADRAGTPRSRDAVRDEVLQARAHGELIAAGDATRFDYGGTSTLTRADVRLAVLEARARGELMASGEQMQPIDAQSRPAVVPRTIFARNTRR